MNFSRTVLFIFALPWLFLIGCTSEDDAGDAGQTSVVVRLPSEPDRLQPEISTSGYAQQLENHLFSAMMQYDPYTLEQIPVLAKSKPQISSWNEEGTSRGLKLQYEIREGAEWENGEPITGEDYLFTLKTFFNPKVNAVQIRGYLDFIRDVTVDEKDPRRFTVYSSGRYFLAELLANVIPVYPKGHYDPDGWLDTFSLQTLKNNSGDLSAEAVAVLDSFASQFSSPEYSRERPMGAGPYRLAEWVPNQRLVLERKEKWWGNRYRGENVFFEANPQKIQYVIMPDEVGAVSALKAGQLDLISKISPQQFTKLKNESPDRFQFFSPALPQYYYVGLNNRDSRLSDRRVRRALMHVLNTEKIRSVVLDSLAQRIVGPIHPGRSFYNDTLEWIDYNPDEARKLLDEANWTDSDGDGIRDKMIEGERVPLSIQLSSTGSQVGNQISLIFQEGASRAGIDITIENKEWRLILQDLRNRTYQMATLVGQQSPVPDDPYQNWHTDNDRPDGSNYYGFGDAESDRVIDSLRVSLDPERRRHWYFRFQEIIHHRQPVLFMVSPSETIVISKKWKAREAVRRPGYFVPQFEAN